MSTGSGELAFENLTGFDVSLDRTTTTVFVMLGMDAVFWWMLYQGHVPMPGMMWIMNGLGAPMAAPGVMEAATFHIGTVGAFVGFFVMWGIMMWAMMHPAMTRFTRDYVDAHQGSAVAAGMAFLAFMTTYHLAWMASAAVPLAFNALLPGGIYGFTKAHTTLTIGGVLVLTGVYQLTGFKQSLLRSCCAKVKPHSHDVVKAFKEGLWHGTRCVLICFGPFFLIMPFFGEMNFFWMVALTTVITIERLPTWGEEIASATGVVSLVAGLIVLVLQPAFPIAFTMSM